MLRTPPGPRRDGDGEARGPPGETATPHPGGALMTFYFNFHHRISDGLVRAALKRLETRLMSLLSDKIAETNASFDAALGRVQGDVQDLNNQVADLKGKVEQGAVTPEDLAALDALRDRIDALDPTKPAVLPEAPAEAISPTPEV